MDKIVTASGKYGSLEKMLKYLSSRARIKTPGDKKATGKHVVARVNLGRLIADCECGGAEMVDPSDLRFFCFSCGNKSNAGKYRPVSLKR